MLYYNREQESIGTFLDRVHNAITIRWQLEEEALVEQANAQKLTWYLRSLKAHAQGKKSLIETELDDQFGQLAMNILSLQRQAGSGVTSAAQLFRRSHGVATSMAEADDIFEEEMYFTLKAVEQMAVKSGVTIPMGGALTGASMANISEEISADKNAANVMDHYVKNIAKRSSEQSEPIRSPYTRPVARAGKVDIQGLSAEVDVSADIKPEWQEFFSLLQGATFSAKNYAGGKYVDNKWISEVRQIHLGNSDIYKAYGGVLSSLGADVDTINQSLSDAYWNCMYKAQESTLVSLRMFQIRFVYELTGAGLIDIGTKQPDEVKYLIWNDPRSPSPDSITVVSTAWLIKQMFEQTEGTERDPFGGIKLSQGLIMEGLS